MAWEKEWGEPVEIGKGIFNEAEKIVDDAAKFGIGFSQAGKHIPIEEVYKTEHTQLTFLDGNKRRSIDVIIVGDLALDYDENGWNIYHVPTLACFSKAVPGYYPINARGIPQYKERFEYSREALLAWMKKVQENYPTSWQMLRLLTPDNHADKGRRTKEIILEWCLSVKVEE